MKKLFLFTSLIVLSWACRSADPDITGTWNGKANVAGSELTIVFHIKADSSGYAGTMDSPDQSATGIPLSSIVLDGNRLTIEIDQLRFTYTGTVDGGRIKGKFVQSGASFALDLERGDTPKRDRPQEPQPPFPYRTEEVTFTNERDNVTLAGTLTLPQGEGPFPAAIMVTGSGPQNRDEELFGHKPFLVIADQLTRNGIAVLRYDDRGTASSTGNFNGSTTEDFTRDALAGFDYLTTRHDINAGKIGVIGHSEGGTIAFMMAARRPRLAFVVSMAGGILPNDSTLVLQNRDIMTADRFDPDVTERYVSALASVYKIMKSEGIDYVKSHLDEVLPRIEGYDGLPELFRNNIVQIMKIEDPWLLYFIGFDPSADILRTACPVFAINGDKDLQVNAAAHIGRMEVLAERSGNSRVVTRIYPGLNHLFQECKTGKVDEYGRIEQTISPVVLDDMTRWIADITN